MIIVRHTHIIKKGEICQKPKTLTALVGGDLASLFFSKVAKSIEVRGDLSSISNVENKKSLTSRPSGL